MSSWGRRKKDGSNRPYKKPAPQGMFFPPRWKWLGDVVKIDTPKNARESIRKLENDYMVSGESKRNRILKAVNLASNRAEVISENKHVSPEQREEARKVKVLYRNSYNHLSSRTFDQQVSS